MVNINLKVKTRLANGYSKPDRFTNNRIIDLVNVLNIYQNCMDKFESIQLIDGSNCLYKKKVFNK